MKSDEIRVPHRIVIELPTLEAAEDYARQLRGEHPEWQVSVERIPSGIIGFFRF